MRLLALGDVHGRVDVLARILAEGRAQLADAILVAGDLLSFLSPGELPPLSALLKTAGRPVMAVAGNCDGPGTSAALTKAGWNLAGTGRTQDYAGFCGVPSAPSHGTFSWTLDETELATLAGAGLRAIAASPVRVMLCHAPPAGTVVAAAQGPLELPGSTALRAAVERWAPDLVVCGHIHWGQGTARLGPTTVVCCGAARDGFYVEIDLPPAGGPAISLRQLASCS